MAYSAIAFVAPNYRDYKNDWLKAYEPGTTTPKAMALDSGGVTQVAKLQLNADGFLVSAGDALVIPYIDGSYDLWLFPTEAEADANNTSNAIRLADDITAVSQASLDLILINDLSQTYNFATVAEYKAFATAFPVGKTVHLLDRGADFTVIAGTGTANTFNIIKSDQVSQSITIASKGFNATKWGAMGDGVTDDTAALQNILDSALQSPVYLPSGTYLCGGLTTITSIYGDGMITTFLKDKDGLAPVLNLLGGTKSLFFRDFRINGLGQGTGDAFKIGSSDGNVNDIDFSNIYIKGFERGLYSIDNEEFWGSNLQGIRIDETDYAFEFIGNTTGYTTISFTECYATITKVGWNLQVFETLTMTNCASDAATETPMNFNYIRAGVINGIYIENCDLGAVSTPNLIKTFNCDSFTINGLLINNNVAVNPIYCVQVNGSGRNIDIRNPRVKNMPNMKMAEIGSSCTKENTNITFAGFDNTEVLFSGDAKIRMPDFENIPLIANTNASGRVTITYADYNIPTWLGKFPTTGLAIDSGAVQPYFLSNYLFSTAMTCDVYSGVDGTNVNAADIPIVVNITCRRI